MSWQSDINITGVGLWGPGLTHFNDLVEFLKGGTSLSDAEFQPPRPAAIPAKERRRAGLMINLAVEAAHQACAHAGVDSAQVPSVFVSSMGDTDITDYMCRKLAQPEKLLSPTKFHNSVHNAPAGYWSISAKNHAASTFAGSGEYSVGMGLLEAASMATELQHPVLLVGYDIANARPFADILPVQVSFAFALIVCPAEQPPAEQPPHGVHAPVHLKLVNTATPQTTPPLAPQLLALSAQNPAATCLALLERIAGPADLGPGSHGALKVATGPACELIVSLVRTSS